MGSGVGSGILNTNFEKHYVEVFLWWKNHMDMLRLFGLFVCVSLAFIFPMYSYNMSDALIVHSTTGTIISCIVVISIFSSYVTTEDVLRES